MNTLERAHEIIECLKKKTDKKHPISQSALRNEIEDNLGTKSTVHNTILDLAAVLNGDKKEDWRLVFDEYSKKKNDIKSGDAQDRKNVQISNLYYNHIFSEEEVRSMVNGVRFYSDLDAEKVDKLIEKIESNFTSVFYQKSPKNVCIVRKPSNEDERLIKENVCVIQEAINSRNKIEFQFNGYNEKGKLTKTREFTDIVNPYYLVAYRGRYYLLGAREGYKNMSIWRVDLMTDVVKLGTKTMSNRDVKGLPPERWDESFPFSHLNMAYDEPEQIILKIKTHRDPKDPSKRLFPDYTFLYDWFGTSFKFIKSDDEKPDEDIVKVTCSPFAMVNWALQYSDRVEVISPKNVRESVIKKIEKLNEKYRYEKK